LKKTVLTIILILSVNIPLQAGRVLTVEDAIDLALENNESYRSAKKELDKANNRIYEVRASALPQLSADFTVLRNWELPSFVIELEDDQGEVQKISARSGSYYNWISALTITQPIYSGGAVFAAWSIAKMYKEFTQNQLNQKTSELKLDVIEAYYGVVMADELLRVAQQTVDLAEANLDVVKKMEIQGTVSDFEVLMAEVRLANVKPRLIEAKAGAKLAHQALNSLIGLGLNDEIDVIWDMDSTLYFVPDYDLDSLKSAVFNNRPEMIMMRLQSQMYKKNISVARSGYRPKINFLTTFQWQAQYDDDKWPNRKDWIRSYYSGISISIPIFDSWRTPAQVKQAKIEYSQSQLNEVELEDNLKLDIEQNWWNYQKSRENSVTQGQAVEMARRGLDIARMRYENGVGTQLELFEAEVALATAETNRVMAFYDLVTGYASLMKALGEEKLLR
jgi:outer membrane protein TolC